MKGTQRPRARQTARLSAPGVRKARSPLAGSAGPAPSAQFAENLHSRQRTAPLKAIRAAPHVRYATELPTTPTGILVATMYMLGAQPHPFVITHVSCRPIPISSDICILLRCVTAAPLRLFTVTALPTYSFIHTLLFCVCIHTRYAVPRRQVCACERWQVLHRQIDKPLRRPCGVRRKAVDCKGRNTAGRYCVQGLQDLR